jgi:hypothetical protein
MVSPSVMPTTRSSLALRLPAGASQRRLPADAVQQIPRRRDLAVHQAGNSRSRPSFAAMLASAALTSAPLPLPVRPH